MRLNELVGILAERPIAFYPILARVGGGVGPGLFMSQLLYWTGKSRSRDGWIYKTLPEWTSETCLSRYELETARRKWRELGVLEEKRAGLPARLFYRVNCVALTNLLRAECALESRSEGDSESCGALDDGLDDGKLDGEPARVWVGESDGAQDDDEADVIGEPANKYAVESHTSLLETSKLECGKVADSHYNTEITTETTTETTLEDTLQFAAQTGEGQAEPACEAALQGDGNGKSGSRRRKAKRASGGEAVKRREVDTRRQHPAIMCLRALNGGRYPPKVLWDEIIALLGDAPDTERVRTFYRTWIARGYNPNSWMWLLDWFKRGEIPPPGANGSGRRAEPLSGVDEAIRMFRESGG